MHLDSLQLLRQRIVFSDDLRRQARDFIDQQAEARFAFNLACVKLGSVLRQRFLQAGAIQTGLNQLVAQFFLRTERHELHAHLLQAGDILFEIFELLFQLQRDQTAHAVAVDARGFSGIVEHFEVAVRGLVDQCREADQRLFSLLDFEQFR